MNLAHIRRDHDDHTYHPPEPTDEGGSNSLVLYIIGIALCVLVSIVCAVLLYDMLASINPTVPIDGT